MIRVWNERIAEIAVALGAPLAALALYFAARGAMQSLREPPRVVVAGALPISGASFALAIDAVAQDGHQITASRAGFAVRRRSVHLTGWAAEPSGKAPFGGLTAYVNGHRLEDVIYGQSRPDVAEHFKNPSLLNVGWTVEIPPALLAPGVDTLKLSFIGAEHDHTYPAPPIALVVK